MTQKCTGGCGLLALVVSLVVGGAAPAQAEPISVTAAVGASVQQTENRPCIIGDPSCSNPAEFEFTLLAANETSGTYTSPWYTVDELREIAGGDTFSVGLDLNQAVGQNGGSYTLESFSLWAGASQLFATTGSTTLLPLSVGNGYSDASIGTFSLAGLDGSTMVQFRTSFSGATAGREQFFLIPPAGGAGGENPVPEPASLILLGSGAAALFAARRRWRGSAETP